MIDIDAAPDEVWPWLVQIGHARGGLYSYDWLENLVGCDLLSADTHTGRPTFEEEEPYGTTWQWVVEPHGVGSRLISRERLTYPSLRHRARQRVDR